MANAAEFLARWTVRYINAEGRIPEELETTVAECVEDANEEGEMSLQFCDDHVGLPATHRDKFYLEQYARGL
jgi:hypothetical protein